jgi:predicted transposase/invertase (TIGR01784 family)
MDTSPPILPPTDDWIFKLLFGDGRLVWGWMQFLRGKRKEDFEMAAEKNPEIRGAVDTLYRLSEDPEVRAQMEYREKARRDHAALLHTALQEGEARSRAEIARNMKSLGLSPEVIEKATGLGPEVIKRL